MTVKVSEFLQKLSVFTMENILFLPFCLSFFMAVGTKVTDRFTNFTLDLAVIFQWIIGALLLIRQTKPSTFSLFWFGIWILLHIFSIILVVIICKDLDVPDDEAIICQDEGSTECQEWWSRFFETHKSTFWWIDFILRASTLIFALSLVIFILSSIVQIEYCGRTDTERAIQDAYADSLTTNQQNNEAGNAPHLVTLSDSNIPQTCRPEIELRWALTGTRIGTYQIPFLNTRTSVRDGLSQMARNGGALYPVFLPA